ncbi:MAG: hypothetical protein DCC55_00765 [Chloroflexi bacterium]|nr:MAG: hypothetical protein DCC55_00765 [Chloroflexota bacterium]
MYRALICVARLLLLAGAGLMLLISSLGVNWRATPLIAYASTGGQSQSAVPHTVLAAPGPQIVITATVGIDPHGCASTKSVTVTAGTMVVYCYNVLNTGDVTFTDHLITDESLGIRAPITNYILTPVGGPQPTFYFTAAVPVLSSVLNTIVWTTTNISGEQAVAYDNTRVVVPAIVVTHTIGSDPHHCADTRVVAVMPGQEVIHCYRVENSGEVVLYLHTAEDSRLGVVAEGWPFRLEPGATAELTVTEVATMTTNSIITWTAAVTEALYATAVDEATILVPAITVSTTVGDQIGACASTTEITVTVGDRVTFCYLASNTSGIDFSPLIVQDQLFNDEPIVVTKTLTNNHGLWFTLTAPITQAMVNTVTWEAQAEGELSAVGTATAFVHTLARIDAAAFEDSNSNLQYDPEEHGFAGITLTLETAGAEVQTGQTGADGRLSFKALKTGPYTLTISTDNLQGYEVNPAMTQPLVVESGKRYTATFALIWPDETSYLHLPLVQR